MTKRELLQDGGGFLGMLDCDFFFPMSKRTKSAVLDDGSLMY